MAINQNHPFEEINGIKCAVVEKNISADRLEFIRPLLELNGYTTVVASTPPKAPAAEGEVPVSSAPETFTVGVTDVGFNVINAIFGRLLKTKDGKIVTLDFWKQKSKISDDTTPYFQKKEN